MYEIFDEINSEFIVLLENTTIENFLNARTLYAQFLDQLNTSLHQLLCIVNNNQVSFKIRCVELAKAEKQLDDSLLNLINRLSTQPYQIHLELKSRLERLHTLIYGFGAFHFAKHSESFYQAIKNPSYLALTMLCDLLASSPSINFWKLNYLASQLKIPPLINTGNFSLDLDDFLMRLNYKLTTLVQTAPINSFDQSCFTTASALMKDLILKRCPLEKMHQLAVFNSNLPISSIAKVQQYWLTMNYATEFNDKTIIIKQLIPTLFTIYASSNFQTSVIKQQLLCDTINFIGRAVNYRCDELVVLNLIKVDSLLSNIEVKNLTLTDYSKIQNFFKKSPYKTPTHFAFKRLFDSLAQIEAANSTTVDVAMQAKVVEYIDTYLKILSTHHVALFAIRELLLIKKIEFSQNILANLVISDILLEIKPVFESIHNITERNKTTYTAKLFTFTNDLNRKLKPFMPIFNSLSQDKKNIKNKALINKYYQTAKEGMHIARICEKLARSLVDKKIDSKYFADTALHFITLFSKNLTPLISTHYHFWLDFLLQWLDKKPKNIAKLTKPIDAILQEGSLAIDEQETASLINTCHIILCLCCNTTDFGHSDYDGSINDFFALFHCALKSKSATLVPALLYAAILFSEDILRTTSLLTIINHGLFNDREPLSGSQADKICFDYFFTMFPLQRQTDDKPKRAQPLNYLMPAA